MKLIHFSEILLLFVNSIFIVGCTGSSNSTQQDDVATITYKTNLDDTGKITGQVKEKYTDEPVIGAKVTLAFTPGALTDIDGHFEISKIPPGVYTISVTMIGYERKTITNVVVQPHITATIDFELAPAIIYIGEPSIYEFSADGPFIQLGGGYNQLFFSDKSNSGLGNNSYHHISNLPSVRIGYYQNHQLGGDGYIAPFIGYNCINGKIGSSFPNLSPAFQFNAFEMGALLGHPITFLKDPLNYMYAEVGIKCNGILNRPILISKDYNFDIGVGLLFKRKSMYISAEAWFGLTSLSGKINNSEYFIRENNFRISIGYHFELIHHSYL